MNNRIEIKKIFSCILFFGLCIELNAVKFDCKHLYIGGQNGRKNNYAEVTVQGPGSFSGVDFYVNPQNENPTLALGPYKKEIVLYWWDYNMYTSAKSGHGSSSPIYYVRSNSQIGSIIPQTPSVINLANLRLSGGTVNQKTGEIYFLTEPCTSTRSISILKPDQSGTFYLSKKSPNLNYTDNNACRAFSSDIVIDADGNAYLLVNVVDDKIYDKSDLGYKLVKIDPNDWSYDSIILQNNIILDDNFAWGMAFLNGKLYVSMATNPAVIYTVDPIKGGVSSYGNIIMQDGSKYGYSIDDMASCQTASAITGKIYLDKNGDGKINDNDKTNSKYQFIPNVIVEIYDSTTGEHIGYQYTNSFGEYSFLVELNKAYYIRVKQPQINGINTHQTWASGGEFGWQSAIGIGNNGINTVTPTCHNTDAVVYDKEQHENWYSGNETKKRYTKSCYGAKTNGIDSSSNSIIGANYYTSVVMRTDLSVAHADFALAPVDRSDAPLNFGEVSHSILQSGVKMGYLVDIDTKSLASANADGDDNNGLNDEDGVEVKADNPSSNWKNLKNFEINNGKYLFRVKVNKKGFLNAWVNINSNSVNLKDFASGTKIVDNIEYNNNTGYIIFPADMDAKIATDGGYINGNKVSKLHNIFFRFRYSSYDASAHNVSLTPTNPTTKSSIANHQPWAINGEVEDYKANYRYVEPTEPKGRLIIVNQNFNLKAGDKKSLNPTDPLFALYTQIVNKPFETKIVYYDENGNGVAKTLENPNLLVKVDLIDFNGNCESSPVVQSVYNDNIAAPINKLSGITINTALKNAAFKTTYSFPNANKNKTACSPDTFAIRPESFILDDSFSGKLIGGDNNIGKIKAVENGGKNSARHYNQRGTNIVSNAKLIAPSSCSLSSDVSNEYNVMIKNFTDGNADISIRYQNVGKVDVSLADREWTNVDSGKSDCIANSGINTQNVKGIVGCDVTVNKEMSFIPSDFLVNAVAHNVHGGNFTYLSDEAEMSAYIDTTVKAMLSDGTVATNYHKDCFAGNVTYDIALTNDAPFGWGQRNRTIKKRLIFFQNNITVTDNNRAKNGIGTFKAEQQKFINGTASNMRSGFNFGHLVTETENPFRLNPTVDFSILRAEDDNTKKVRATIGGDNITLFYGRAFIDNYEGESPIPAEVKYELFCQNCERGDFNITLSSMNIKNINWFLNHNHNDKHGNISRYTSRGKSLVTDKMAVSNGRGAIKLRNNSGTKPYQDIIYAEPRNWLVNVSKNTSTYKIDFTVKFTGGSESWAGKGEVNSNDKIGKVINVKPNNKTAKKMEW
ncbi:MAG: hypothetical protein LBL65_01935 [Campylobacteraceae bacterium]|jgi:hypothetical protein|nr:hypothetical protein [Campylobacteraceae bacterium]